MSHRKFEREFPSSTGIDCVAAPLLVQEMSPAQGMVAIIPQQSFIELKAGRALLERFVCCHHTKVLDGAWNFVMCYHARLLAAAEIS